MECPAKSAPTLKSNAIVIVAIEPLKVFERQQKGLTIFGLECLSLSMSTQAEKQRPAEEAHLGILGESICIHLCERCKWGPAGGQRPA